MSDDQLIRAIVVGFTTPILGALLLPYFQKWQDTRESAGWPELGYRLGKRVALFRRACKQRTQQVLTRLGIGSRPSS